MVLKKNSRPAPFKRKILAIVIKGWAAQSSIITQKYSGQPKLSLSNLTQDECIWAPNKLQLKQNLKRRDTMLRLLDTFLLEHKVGLIWIAIAQIKLNLDQAHSTLG